MMDLIMIGILLGSFGLIKLFAEFLRITDRAEKE